MSKPTNHPDLLQKAAAIARRRLAATTPGSQAAFRAALALALIEIQINKLTPVRIPTETIDVRV